MRNFTRNVFSKVKYKVLITMVVVITAFFAYINIFNSYAYITNNTAINLGSGKPTLTRWDATSNNHGYVNFGLFPKTKVLNDSSLYTALENATALDHYLFKMGSSFSDAPLANSPIVYYQGDYYVKDKSGANIDAWFKMEPITWKILNVDETNDKVLLFADEVIESRRWNDSTSTYLKWSDSPDILKDLNYDQIGLTYYDTSFYNKAFSPNEKDYIKNQANDYQYADRDGSAMQLYVRLLSAYEMFTLKNGDNVLFNGGANYGFASNNGQTGISSNRLGYPTNYAMMGTDAADLALIDGIGEVTIKYWTRSAVHTTSGENHAQYIACNGKSSDHDLYNKKLGVRPVITIDLDFFKDEIILGSGTQFDPYYAKVTYNVNYNLGDANSGSVPSMTEVNAGDTYTLSDIPLTKDSVNIGCVHFNIGDGSPVVDSYVVNSFIQDGWTTSLGGAKVYSLGETITPNGDLDLYPSWSVTTTPAPFPSVPLREGYVWDGWEDRPDGTGNPITSYSGNSPHYQIYGTWHPQSFRNSVTFVGNGGTGVPSELFHIMDYPNTQYTFTIPAGEPTRSGYSFDGWYDSPSSGNKYTTNIVSGENNHIGDQVTYVYAHWTRTTAPATEVELIIDPNGGLYEGQASKVYSVHKHDGSETEDGACYSVTYHVHTGDSVNGGGCYEVVTSSTPQPGLSVVYCGGRVKIYHDSSVSYWDGTPGAGWHYGAYCESCGKYFEGNTPMDIPNTDYAVYTCDRVAGYRGTILTCDYSAYTSGEQVPGNVESHTKTCLLNDYQVISNPVKDGYTFTGWSSSTEYNTYTESSETRWKGDSDTTITAVYSANTYTVSFNADNGGNNPSSQSVTYGSAYGTLPSPIKTGYDFEGWYTSASGGSKVTSTTIVSIASNHTLYARYTPKNITVSFSAYTSVDNPEDITVTFNSAYGSNLPSAPLNDRVGYSFDGWFKSASGGTKVTSATIVTNGSNHTLYAHYTPLNFDIIYYRGDATSTNVPESQIATYDSNLTLAVNNMTKHDSANGYVITYNMGVATGGDLPSASIQTTSYTADGWSGTLNGSKLFDSGYVFSPYQNLNGFALYPHWIETKNKVTLESNTLTKDPTAKSTVTYKFQDGVTSDVNRNVMSLYTPNGWSTTNGGAKAYDNADEIDPSSNMDLYPYFDSTNEPVTFPSITPRDGYTFREWNTKADGTGETVTSYNGTSNLTLYAIWDGISVTNTLKYSANGGDNAPSDDIANVTYPNTKHTFTISSQIPTKAGYNFKGWYTQAGGGTKVSSSQAFGDDNVLNNQVTYIYAHWEKIGVITSVDLTINPSGGIYDGDTNVKTYEVHVHDGSMTEEGECYDIVYHTHTDACKSLSYKLCNNQTGTILSGYDYDADNRMCTIRCSACGGTCNNLVNKAYPNGYDVSGCLLQHRNPTPTITYTCAFGSYNGDHVPGNIESATMTCTEDDFKVIDVPVKTGYTFTNWTSDTGIDTYTESSETRWKGNSDTVLTANYSVNNYTVSFVDSQFGSNPSNMTVTYDSPYGTLPSRNITGYTFLGWYTSDDGGTKINDDTIVKTASDHTLYARYSINRYQVQFKNKDGITTLFSTQGYDYNDQIGDIYDASHIPTLDGYLFGGWYLDTDTSYSNKITSSYNVTSNITLVPRWYEVSFDALNKEYTGSNVEPDITVSDDSATPVTLTKDSDYTVSDTGDKINYGSRTITVSGDNSKGIYGSVSKTFTIERKPINYSDVIILNYNNTDNTINKEFDLNDKTNVKILANDIILAYSSDTNIRFSFDLDNSYYSSASPSNSIHKDITLSNIRIDSATSNNHYYNGPSSLTFTAYGMIKDTIRPVVNSCEIISPANIYGLGQEIIFKVTTNEDLIPSGTPTIKLKINSPSDNDMGYADLDSSNPLNDSHTFIFKHIVTTSDNGVLGKLKLALDIEDGSYTDDCNNELNADLTDSNLNIKDIEINTDGFIIPSSMNPNILASEVTDENVVTVTYDLSSINLKSGYTLDTLISNLVINSDIDGAITNITSDTNIVTITKDTTGTNNKVTASVDTTKILNDTTNYRNGITLTFDIPKEVLVNYIDNKNIASHNEIKVLRTLNDSDIIVKHNGNILDHLGTIIRAYENDVIEVLLKDGALGSLSYDQMPNDIITSTLYKFTNFILTKVNYVSSIPFDVEFKVRTKQDVIDDINAIITDTNKDDDTKTNDLKDILDNKKDLDFFNPPLTDEDIDYILDNSDDISKIFIDDNDTPISDDDDLVQRLKDAIEKDKANKAPKKKKKKLNVKEQEVIVDDKGEEKVVTHVSYLVGYKDGTLKPEGVITRGEISSVISHLSADFDDSFDYTSNLVKYKDLNKNAWHSNYLGFLSRENIYEGYSDKTMRPERYITRGEFSKAICILFDLDVEASNKNNKHIFKDSKNKWYEKYINTLYEYGYLEGYKDNTFRGNKSITRAEAVKIINKALNRKLKDDTTLTKEERLAFENKFKDVFNKWYYYDLYEATMSY